MIEITGVKKSYSGKSVLKGVNLVINDGSIHAIIGKNGCGKTTLIKIIADLIKVDSGKVIVDGFEITNIDPKYRSKMGYVFDEPILIRAFTVEELLFFYLFMNNLSVEGYYYRVEDLCILFELPKETRVENLSKGQKMKLSFASSLLHKPFNLILDEPFAGVDLISIEKIKSILIKLKENGVSILISSHRVEIISNIGDSFSILKNGLIENTFKNESNLSAYSGLNLNNKIPDSLMEEFDFEIPSWIYER